MSEDFLSPVTGPRPPVATKLASLHKTVPSASSAPVAAPAINPPSEDNRSEKIIASITLADGKKVQIYADRKTKGLSTEARLMKMFDRLAEMLKKHEGKLEIFDPHLYALWHLNAIIISSLPDAHIVQLENFISQLPEHKLKPFLWLKFVQVLWQNSRINYNKAHSILLELAGTNPKLDSILDAYCQFLASNDKHSEAAAFLLFKLTGERITVNLSHIGKIINQQSNHQIIFKLGDHLKLWAENETDFQKAKDLLLAASLCYARALFLAPSPKMKFDYYSRQAELYLAFALLERKDPVFDPKVDNKVDYVKKSIRCQEQAVRLAAQPDRDLVRIKLGKLYMIAVNHSEKESDAREYLKKASACLEKLSPQNIEGRTLLANVYAKLNQFDKAIRLIDQLIILTPQNPFLFTLRGDFYFASGKVGTIVTGAGPDQKKSDLEKTKKAIASYRRAFEIAKHDTSALALVYNRFILLRTQSLSELGTKPSPNILKILLRGLAHLFTYANPLNIATQIIASLIYPQPGPKHTREELEYLIRELDQLEKQAWKDIKPDLVFSLATVRSLSGVLNDVDKLISLSKNMLSEPELTESFSSTRKYLKQRIQQQLMLITFNCLPDPKFKKMIASGSMEEIILGLRSVLERIAIFRQLANDLNLPSDIRARIKGNLKSLRSTLAGYIDLALKVSRQKNIPELPYYISKMLGEIRLERSEPWIARCFDALIAIFEEKKDRDSLLALAMDKELKYISLNSLRAVMRLSAEEADLPRQIEIGDVAAARSREAKEEPLASAWRGLALHAFRSAFNTAKGNNDQQKQAVIAVSLWRAGHHEESISIFEGIASAMSDPKEKGNLFVTLYLMNMALGRSGKAIEYLEKALRLKPGDRLLQKELDLIRNRSLPGEISFKGSQLISPQRLRAVLLLYSQWTSRTDLEALLPGIREFFLASGYRVELKLQLDPASRQPVIYIHDRFISGIKVKNPDLAKELDRLGIKKGVLFNGQRINQALQAAASRFHIDHWSYEEKNGYVILHIQDHFEVPFIPEKRRSLPAGRIEIIGNTSTKTRAILRELAFAGLKAQKTFDWDKLKDVLLTCQNRLQTFTVENVRLEEKNGMVIVRIYVKEVESFMFMATGGGGNLSAFAGVGLGSDNLFGGGEKIGGMYNYQHFFANGYRSFSMHGGKLYYKDPYLFSIGKVPIAGGVLLERYARLNLTNQKKETLTGGSLTLGINISPNTTLSLSPGFHHNSAGHYRQGFKFEIAHDKRNNWLFPSSGYHLSAYVQPGAYFGGFSGGYVQGGLEARKYFPLPEGFSLALSGKGVIGYHLAGGDLFYLADGFVRSNKKLNDVGPAAIGSNIELKSRVTDLNYVKFQPYTFFDYGCTFKSRSNLRCGMGIGVGVRILLLGIIFNLYVGFPSGFGFRISPPGMD